MANLVCNDGYDIMNTMKKLLVCFLIAIFGFSLHFWVFADEFDDISQELEKTKQELEASKQATAQSEGKLNELATRLANIKARVAGFEQEIARKEEQIAEGEKQIGEQKVLLDDRVVSYYKNVGKVSDSFMEVFLGENLSKSLNQFFYQKSAIDEDRKIILRVALQLETIEERKIKLQSEKEKLIPLKQQLDTSFKVLAQQVFLSKQQEAQLERKIASLTARQQQILAQKLSSLNLPSSLGSGTLSCTDDRKIDPGFSGGFAFYTFGIPHGVGINQYGAFGRAKEGQDHKTIINAYFNNVRLECRSTPTRKIQVQGYGEVGLEEYLKGIYEMPGSWPLEALKTQVIAARTYAIKYTNNGSKEICTTQSCQVYKGGNKGGNWEEAVKQTGEGSCSDGQGLVIISNDTNEPITAWYASTFGGYTRMSSDVGWSNTPWTKRMQDATSPANSFAELFEKAYDRDSPCFYAAQGSRSEYNKSAWLKNEEVADITNVLLLGKKDSSTQVHLSQPDKSNPDGVETWNADKVKSELSSRGITPVNSVSNVSIDWDKGVGITTNITVTGDTGTHTFSGQEFKAFFNLRAPANIQIVGGLFNVERR